MKRIIPFTLLITILVGCATPASTTGTGITNPVKPIETQAGGTFDIVIDSNPSTGYHWEIVGELSGIEFVSREYKADEPIIPGSGGYDIWTFRAVDPGEAQITLGSYPPSASDSEPEQTVTFDIVVK